MPCWKSFVALALLVFVGSTAGRSFAQDSPGGPDIPDQSRDPEGAEAEMPPLTLDRHASEGQQQFLYSASHPEEVATDTSQQLEERLLELEEKWTQLEEAEQEQEAAAASRPSVKLGGRIMTDWVYYDQDSNNKATLGDLDNGAEFRRARLRAEGDLFEFMDYQFEVDFAGGDAVFKDVYIGFNDLPCLGDVLVGHFKEPFSLEELTSSRYITFMERGLPNVFAPARKLGVASHNHSEDERMTWAIGTFRGEFDDDTGEFNDDFSDDNGQVVTARVTYLPWYAPEGQCLLHVGAGYSFRHDHDDSVRFRQRPEAHLSDTRFVDTGAIVADDIHLFGAEAALVSGPFSVQSEYIVAFVDQFGGPDLDFQGVYVYASYFLTGESRAYRPTRGSFSRVSPLENFYTVESDEGICCGKGAWELAFRWSYLDLNDDNIAGGRLHDITLGLNWYLNPYTRLMFNYIHAFLDDPVFDDSDANIFAMRAMIDW